MNDIVRIQYGDYEGTYLDVKIDDASVRFRSIMGENNVTLRYQLPEFTEIPLGAYIEYEGETYTLNRPATFKKNGPDYYDYTLILEAPQYQLRKYRFRNLIDGRLKFSYTGTATEFMNLLVDNMNNRSSGWTTRGAQDFTNTTTLSFNHVSCADALQMIANAFETEWEVVGKLIRLWKVEYNILEPYPLSYGKEKGFKPGLGRINFSNSVPINVLYTNGGSRNINPTTYGSELLRMKKNYRVGYDGYFWDDNTNFDRENGRFYLTDALGMSLTSRNAPVWTGAEDSLDLSTIYPERVGTVTEVIPVGEFWDFTDTSIPGVLDYAQYRIPGEIATVVFQTGMLAGKEFDIEQTEDALTGYIHSQRRFRLVSREIDGQIMPNAGTGFIMQPGDKYAVFHIALPQEYIDSAEEEMTRRAVKYLWNNENPKFTFSGELDGVWASEIWNDIVPYIRLGGYINFSDDQFQLTPVRIRITAIRDYLVRPHYPVIDLSNSPIPGTLSSTIKDLETEEVKRDDAINESNSLTKRSYWGARELIGLLEGAVEGFAAGINPVTVQTMQILLGSENLQFAYVNSRTDHTIRPATVIFRLDNNTFTAQSGVVRHMINNGVIAPNDPDGYVYYDVGSYERSFIPAEDTIPYYVYLTVQAGVGVVTLSNTSLPFRGEVEGKFNLLVGVISSVLDGSREFAPLYGFTEILPGQITTNLIRSADGQSYFDLEGNALRAGSATRALEWNVGQSGALSIKGALIETQDSGGRIIIDPSENTIEFYDSQGRLQTEIGSVQYSALSPALYTYNRDTTGNITQISSLAGDGLRLVEGNTLSITSANRRGTLAFDGVAFVDERDNPDNMLQSTMRAGYLYMAGGYLGASRNITINLDGSISAVGGRLAISLLGLPTTQPSISGGYLWNDNGTLKIY